jgi:hypothetical protein
MSARKPEHLRPRLRLGRTSKSFRSHAMVVGELVWASNYCLWTFSMLYGSLFAPDDMKIAKRTWRGTRGDQAQLNLVEHAVRGNKRLNRRKAAAVLWALDKARKLAEQRNDAVHVFVEVRRTGKPTVRPSPHTIIEKRFAKLSAITDLTRHFGTVRDDFIRIADYVEILWLYSEGTHLDPLPSRPRLRTGPGK